MRRIRIAALLLGLPAVLGTLLLLAAIDATTAVSTLIGCGIATIGGLLSGAIAERLLHRGRSGADHVAGIVATTTVSVMTVGFIYLVQLQGPVDAIGMSARAVEQVLAFTQFLTAQAAGIMLTLSADQPRPTP